MSLLIKGMDLPETCKDCVFREYPRFSFELDWCCINGKTIQNPKERSTNCPLVEIPTPHGRLIDADALQAEADSQPCFWKGAIDELMVRKAPTVIEAEEEND